MTTLVGLLWLLVWILVVVGLVYLGLWLIDVIFGLLVPEGQPKPTRVIQILKVIIIVVAVLIVITWLIGVLPPPPGWQYPLNG
jgi:hypothetical protein